MGQKSDQLKAWAFFSTLFLLKPIVLLSKLSLFLFFCGRTMAFFFLFPAIALIPPIIQTFDMNDEFSFCFPGGGGASHSLQYWARH